MVAAGKLICQPWHIAEKMTFKRDWYEFRLPLPACLPGRYAQLSWAQSFHQNQKKAYNYG